MMMSGCSLDREGRGGTHRGSAGTGRWASAVCMFWCLVAALASCGQQLVQPCMEGEGRAGLQLRNTNSRLGAASDDVCTMLTGSCTC